MVKPTATTKDDAQALFKSLRSAYSATPTNLKIIDLYVAFAVFTAIIQVWLKSTSPRVCSVMRRFSTGKLPGSMTDMVTDTKLSTLQPVVASKTR
nr:dolichyl-diphosphooligosaccharide--protein glycosyltransferase subunit DAD1 [Tanacetum cinerariifolium]